MKNEKYTPAISSITSDEIIQERFDLNFFSKEGSSDKTGNIGVRAPSDLGEEEEEGGRGGGGDLIARKENEDIH